MKGVLLWRYGLETLSAISVGIHRSMVDPFKKVHRFEYGVDVFFVVSPNKLLTEPSSCR